MSLKQFPAHGTFSKARDEFNQKQDKPPPPPEPRSVATVFDVEDAWEMLDKRQQHEKMTNFKLGDHEKLDAARIAAAAGIKVTANFSVAQAVEKYRMEKLREMLIYCVFLIFFTVSVIHNRMVPERGMLLSSIKGAYMDNRFITTDGGTSTNFAAISSKDEFWDWMTQALPLALFSGHVQDLSIESMEIPVNSTCGSTPGCVVSTLPPEVPPAPVLNTSNVTNATNSTSRRLLGWEEEGMGGVWEEGMGVQEGRRQQVVKSKEQIKEEEAAAKAAAKLAEAQAERALRMNQSTSLTAEMLSQHFPNSDYDQGMVRILNNNYFVQPVRIRQVRVNSLPPIDCNPGADMLLYDSAPTCWPVYSKNTTQTNGTIPGYPPGQRLEYMSGNETAFEAFSAGAVTMEYDGGGFSIDLPVNLTMGSIRAILTSLREQRWTDEGTRAVFVDMVTYNPPLNIFVSCRLAFEFTVFGDVRASSQFRAFPLNIKMEDFNFAVLYYLEILSYLIIFGFGAFDCWKIYKVGASTHFSSSWNCVGFLNYLSFLLAIQRQRGIASLPVSISYAEPVDNITSTRIPVEVYDFEYAGSEYSFYSCLLGFSIMISWLRIVTYIKFFNGAMSRIVTIVGECIESCLIWFLMIFIVVVAYAQCFYLAFGPDVEGFDSFEASLATICTWVFSIVDYSEIVRSDEFIAGWLFASFQLTYTIILLNMFLVILMRSYSDSSNRGNVDVIAAEVRKVMTQQLIRMKEFIKDRLAEVAGEFKKWFEGDDDGLVDEGMHGTTAAKEIDAGEDWEEGSVWPKAKWNEGLKKLVKGIAKLSRELEDVTERVDDLVKTKRHLEQGEDVHSIAVAGQEIADDPDSMAGLVQPKVAPQGMPGRLRTSLRKGSTVSFKRGGEVTGNVRGLKSMKGPNSHPLAPTTPTARVSFKISGAAFGLAEEGRVAHCSPLAGGWVDGGHVTDEGWGTGSGVGGVKGSCGNPRVGLVGGDAGQKRAGYKFEKAISAMEGLLAKGGDLPPTSGSDEGNRLDDVMWAGPNKLIRIARPGDVLRRRRTRKGERGADVDGDVGGLPVAITMAEKLELGAA